MAQDTTVALAETNKVDGEWLTSPSPAQESAPIATGISVNTNSLNLTLVNGKTPAEDAWRADWLQSMRAGSLLRPGRDEKNNSEIDENPPHEDETLKIFLL